MSLKDRSLRLLEDHQAWGLVRGPLPYRMLRYRLRTTSFEASDTDLLPQVARGDAPQGNEVSGPQATSGGGPQAKRSLAGGGQQLMLY